MNSSARIILTVATAALASATLVGCTINIGTPGGSNSMQGPMGQNGNSEFSNADLMFAEMMIPHHQQALDMSALAEGRTTNTEILALSQQIADAQAPEIVQMQSWIDESGGTSGMGSHEGHMMGGMLTKEQMDALRDASGVEFDRLYLEGMIEHHEGALQMVNMIENSSNDEVRALADAITTSQTAEIDKMQELLKSL